MARNAFEIYVNGHKYLTANNRAEKIDDLICLIERRAKRNGHIGEDDRIERLQIMTADGSDVAELADDMTLGDIGLLASGRRINAVVWSPPPPPPPAYPVMPMLPMPTFPPLAPGPAGPPSQQCTPKKSWVDWSWCWKVFLKTQFRFRHGDTLHKRFL
ncbi:hypothetical protein CBR_g45248 [Chara braunii]|uniref:DWNN domain-containing protein n=1 Tax=Chara braunii TaxID=69332 RepID=A0A388K3B0_CHABU|nr:hypothetical protein CBR_g45248 [Chara braunii]|eukprot:GBG64554.1 hypothetical protein CBR_g45248 [Chara braunii]